MVTTFTNKGVSITIDGGKGDDSIQGGTGNDVLIEEKEAIAFKEIQGTMTSEGSDGNDTFRRQPRR
jgi:Ca2+-binding RTX toxin-like protein